MVFRIATAVSPFNVRNTANGKRQADIAPLMISIIDSSVVLGELCITNKQMSPYASLVTVTKSTQIVYLLFTVCHEQKSPKRELEAFFRR